MYIIRPLLSGKKRGKICLFSGFILAVLLFFISISHGLSAQEKFSLIPEKKPYAYPIHVTDLINTPEFIEQAVENTRIMNPAVYNRALQKMADPGFEIQNNIGDEKNFFVLNFVKQEEVGGSVPVAGWFDEVNSRLMAIGEKAHIWVAIDQLDSSFVTQTEVDAILRALEDISPPASRDPEEGIFEIVTEYFGLPPNINSNGTKGAGDGKTDVLLTDIKDGWQPGQGYVAGFFYTLDQLTTNQFSNKSDLIYVDTKPGIYNPNTQQRNPNNPLSTVAHEYQHLVFYNYKGSTAEVWFNEGLSLYAEVTCGYPLRSPGLYYANTNRPVNFWASVGDQTVLQDYSRVALWTLYLAEQLGDNFIRNVVQLPGSNGITVVNNAAQQVGSMLRFTDLLQNWVLANYINDGTVDEKYGYTYNISSKPSVQFSYDDPNITRTSIGIEGYAAQYIDFSYGEDLEITFTGGSGIFVRAIEHGDEIINIVPVTPGVLYSQPAYGDLYDRISFVVTNTGGASSTFGYTASGEALFFVDEFTYDDGTPKVFTGNAAYFGFGGAASEVGSGWAVDFQPLFPDNQLLAARLYIRFDNEFPGSSTPSTASKAFRFHVWDDNGDLPGQDLIEPFVISFARSDFPGDFTEIDLREYQEELSDLSDKIYIGFTETDTVGTYLGMSNVVSANHTYVFIGPTSSVSPQNRNTWFPLSSLSLSDGTSLAGWNMMMRARFSLVDRAIPSIQAGFLQNPIFSELVNIYAMGSTPLRLNTMEGEVSGNGESRGLTFKEIANSDSRIFFDDTYTLSSDGEVTVHIRGRQKFGTIFADTTVQFTARLFKQHMPGVLTSVEGGMSVAFEEQSVREDSYFTLYEGNPDIRRALYDPPMTGVAKLYTFGPVGTRLNVPATVSLKASGRLNFPEYTLALFYEGEWRTLPTEYDSQNGEYSTHTSNLGLIGLIEKSVAGEPIHSIPATFTLRQNYPNPFNPTTTIEFDLPKQTRVTMKIYDMLGREIRTLIDDIRPEGFHQVVWDARNDLGTAVASGIYVYRISADEFTESKRMVLIR
jgi:hypothetical protein